MLRSSNHVSIPPYSAVTGKGSEWAEEIVAATIWVVVMYV